MIDREKVVKALERCLICDISVVAPEEAQKAYRECEYTVGLYCGQKKVLQDALALLKEQGAKNGYWINPTSQDCHCSECGEQPVHEPGESVPLYDYCPYCGAKMEAKWNE